MALRMPQPLLAARTRRTRSAASASAAPLPPPPQAAPVLLSLRAARLPAPGGGLSRSAPSLVFQVGDAAVGEAEAAPAEEEGYSKASYYTTLGLFLISFPGLYSLVKRSAKSKIVQKVFAVPGPSAADAVPLDERAKALFAYFKRNNYDVVPPAPGSQATDVITFKGNIQPERGTAAYITFCAFVGLGSAALVLSIAQPAIGDAAYWLTGLSPAAGAYYWVNAAREEVVKLKMVTADDDATTDITVEGGDEEVERLAKELDLVEKGKIKVKGLLEAAR